MAADTLLYQGINRSATDYSGGRACEELINLRPTTDGLVPVKDFDVMFSGVTYDRIYVHHSTSGDRYIAIRRGEDTVYAQWIDDTLVSPFIFFQIEIEGASASEISAVQDRVIAALSYASAGNVILFSVCDAQDGIFGNWAFTWKDGTYKVTEADPPPVSYTVTETLGTAMVDIQEITARDLNPAALPETVDNAISRAQEENPGLCLGPIVLAVAFRTKDGNTFWTNGWSVYDPVPKVNTDTSMYITDQSAWGAVPYLEQADYFSKYGNPYAISGTQQQQYGGISKLYFEGTKLTLTLAKLNAGDWDKDTSLIQSVEVYSSRPQTYLDTSKTFEGLMVFVGSGGAELPAYLVLPKTDYSKLDLGDQPLYLQASIPLASLSKAAQTVELTFGGNRQVTNDTLDVDAGEVRRYGRLISYNARFHYFDSVAKIGLGMPSFNIASSTNQSVHKVFVQYDDENQSGIYYVGDTAATFPNDKRAYFVIASSVNVKEVITYTQAAADRYITRHYRMTASGAYNYAICVGSVQSYMTESADSNLESIASGGITGVSSVEPAAINVTEQYDPFVFRVEHSYLAPGTIIDVQPQMAFTADVSYGEYPLNVFTNRGLYALTQGSADVLYGAFKPLSNLVAKRGAIPVGLGTFFVAAGALWLISGINVTLVSDALSRGPHKYIRSCPGYKRISGGPGVSTSEYDVSALVSAVEFEVFCEGAKLAYNRFREEIFVSNPAYDYTYVLSLKYRQWFKVAGCVYQDEPGSTIANIPVSAGAMDVVDLESEVAGHVTFHLQSRPFSYGYQYAHLHRLLSMLRAELSGLAADEVVLALYGSDDLQDWTLLAYAKRAGSTVTEGNVTSDVPLRLSQIRTAPASRSWRYHTVCIGGKVHTETEFGPFITDYEVVPRRIG